MPTLTKPTKAPKPKPAPKPATTEHQMFTDLLNEIRPTAIETTLLLEGEEIHGTIRLYDLLQLYLDTEFANEARQRQDDRNALAAILEPLKRGKMAVVQKHQTVLRFYGWLTEHGYVSRKDYEQVLAIAKRTIGGMLA